MDYEKAYNEALERANKFYEANTNEGYRQIFEEIFPELKESDDERIRKYLIDVVNDYVIGSEHEGCIAWLEKQGSQNLANSAKTCKVEPKSADKVESKQNSDIEKGKWYVCDTPRYVDFAVGKVYLCPKNGMLKPNENEMARYVAKHCFHLWTIQDAKDGDVLSFNDGHGNDSIELIKSITEKKIEFWFCLTNGNRYEVFDGIIPYTNLVSREDATPATKEQRDTLFAKMHEAGYKWDAEKKELRKIEQNSAWSEEDEKEFKWICVKLQEHSMTLAYTERVRKAMSWLKSLKERYTWKPTKQQMEALKVQVEEGFGGPLSQLYNDLKALCNK